jgi:hypothetical protein
MVEGLEVGVEGVLDAEEGWGVSADGRLGSNRCPGLNQAFGVRIGIWGFCFRE